MVDYNEIIKIKYPEARGPFEEGQNYELESYPDAEGNYVTRISLWTLEAAKPSIKQLDTYAQTKIFIAAISARRKAAAEAQVNGWANAAVMAMKILEPELFFVAMISNVAFRLLEWNSLGKPTELDPGRFVVTIAEAKAYSETTVPEMTPAQLLGLQEGKWLQMQQGFAAIVYKRRVALEKIKMAPADESLSETLAAILAGLTV